MKKVIRIIFLLFVSVVITLTTYANALILAYGKGEATVNAVPTRSVALIFGGGMQSHGVQSERQEDRVKRGVELYKAGKAKKLVMTGDDGGMNADEVSVMRQQAIDLGVREQDIIVDPHGYRTYESCWRAKHVYQIDQALAVSQSFHVPRILYLCNSLGIPTFGVSADLQKKYDDPLYMEVREALARVKALLDITIRKPLPRVAQ